MTIVVGFAADKDVTVNRTALLYGKTLKGSIFGGIRPRSDLPSIIEKCVDKVGNIENQF